MCRTSTPEEACAQACVRPRARGAETSKEERAARTEAAALHYLRTGEEVLESGEMDVAAVTCMLQLEATGAYPCGDCTSCMGGGSCKRASNREAARRGKRGALWAEEAQSLVGRMFQVSIDGALKSAVALASGWLWRACA